MSLPAPQDSSPSAPLPGTVYIDGACTANDMRGRRDKALRHAAYGIFVAEGHPWNEAGRLPHSVAGRGSELVIDHTNQAAEMYALWVCVCKIWDSVDAHSKEAPDKITPVKTIEVKSDSMYIVKMFTVWARRWELDDWCRRDIRDRSKRLPIKNLLLVQLIYYRLLQLNRQMRIRVKLIHVPAHSAQPSASDSLSHMDWYGNMMADKLARQAAAS